MIDQSTEINFFLEEIEIEIPFNEDLLRTWVLEVIENHKGKCGELNFIFCSDDYLLNINQEHLNHDYYTDIITFQLDPGLVDGDIFISMDRVLDNAQQLGVKFEHELLRVIIHGVLHMLGHTDKTEDESNSMRATEDNCINRFNELVAGYTG